ncbi:hypothetical protein JKP88DRAFT_283368 [Tribonema minus]|uniref:Uncharacterized protein n=1 Tax=Tribonema minus TaxID=303371 RepID=A0A835YJR9_9STRA|nr:hypothetical protein JKP88DRAFT_283368 [Tribonema minus]
MTHAAEGVAAVAAVAAAALPPLLRHRQSALAAADANVAAGPPLPPNTTEGEGCAAYFLKRAAAIAFVGVSQDTFGGVPPCMDTVCAAALGQLYDGINPPKLLLDAAEVAT